MGLFSVGIYASAAHNTPGRRPELSEAVALFFAVNGVMASIRLFAVVFTAKPLGVLSETDKLYLAVGALATMWVSFGAIGRTFGGLEASQATETEQVEAED